MRRWTKVLSILRGRRCTQSNKCRYKLTRAGEARSNGEVARVPSCISTPHIGTVIKAIMHTFTESPQKRAGFSEILSPDIG